MLSIVLLMLCILTGLVGTQNLYANFNMTFFWIVFVLGVPYLTALIGDFYAAVNPWKAIVEGLESLTGRAFDGRRRQRRATGLLARPASLPALHLDRAVRARDAARPVDRARWSTR